MPFRPFLKSENVCIDNNVFKMHYKLTVIMLLGSSILVTSKQFFGEPIHCISHGEKNIDAINSFCWIFGTYTVKNRLKGKIGKDMASFGVGPSVNKSDEMHHLYYQWVCLVLLLQAALFYLPRYLWKVWEGGRLRILAADLVGPIIPETWTEERKNVLVNYLSSDMYMHNFYAFRYAFCELLNCVNVIAQIFILDIFLDGGFRSYGATVASFYSMTSNQREYDPMAKYFPKATKCLFYHYGSSGDLQSSDFLCILPLNVVNEKVFLVLWFWLLFLAFASIISVIYRLLLFMIPPFRTYLLMAQVRYIPKYHINTITKHFTIGDWFILHQLGKTVNPLVFKDLVLELGKEIDRKPVMI